MAPLLRSPLTEVSAIGARGQAGDPAKCRAKRAGVVVSDGKTDIGHRHRVLCKQCLAAFDALRQLVALGRHAEGLTESAAEIAGAQANQARQRRKRYGFGKMLLDISD